MCVKDDHILCLPLNCISLFLIDPRKVKTLASNFVQRYQLIGIGGALVKFNNTTPPSGIVTLLDLLAFIEKTIDQPLDELTNDDNISNMLLPLEEDARLARPKYTRQDAWENAVTDLFEFFKAQFTTNTGRRRVLAGRTEPTLVASSTELSEEEKREEIAFASEALFTQMEMVTFKRAAAQGRAAGTVPTSDFSAAMKGVGDAMTATVTASKEARTRDTPYPFENTAKVLRRIAQKPATATEECPAFWATVLGLSRKSFKTVSATLGRTVRGMVKKELEEKTGKWAPTLKHGSLIGDEDARIVSQQLVCDELMSEYEDGPSSSHDFFRECIGLNPSLLAALYEANGTQFSEKKGEFDNEELVKARKCKRVGLKAARAALLVSQKYYEIIVGDGGIIEEEFGRVVEIIDHLETRAQEGTKWECFTWERTASQGKSILCLILDEMTERLGKVCEGVCEVVHLDSVTTSVTLVSLMPKREDTSYTTFMCELLKLTTADLNTHTSYDSLVTHLVVPPKSNMPNTAAGESTFHFNAEWAMHPVQKEGRFMTAKEVSRLVSGDSRAAWKRRNFGGKDQAHYAKWDGECIRFHLGYPCNGKCRAGHSTQKGRMPSDLLEDLGKNLSLK
ncbi:hypothetical protein TrCOL_g7262 [Triparma columacea]|uniref:Uncharacterized protein n=1 Tax=Triparma columacea TaxID=722753 RepID=A0A9W7G3M1_9STRA|nr:hypothetical protein TrCOL_g7262 [Triparma columacea]